MKKETIINNSGFTEGNIVESINYIDFYSIAKGTKDFFKRDFYSSRVFHNSSYSQFMTSDFWNNVQVNFSNEENENSDVFATLTFDDSISFNEVILEIINTINSESQDRKRGIMLKSIVLHLLMYNKFNYIDENNIELIKEDILYVREIIKKDILDKGMNLSFLPKTYAKLLLENLNETKWTITQCNKIVKEICLSIINKYDKKSS